MSLGVSTDVNVQVRAISVQETVTVIGQSDAVFSSTRTGAATAVSREQIATLPNLTNRLDNFTRLTPQASGLSMAGQDPRMNNITVDGSYFNNSFGLGNTPGDRTGVAPISPEAVEQIQVNVAPFDVRQGNFVGAGINTVTRSGTNQFTGSVYHQFRDQDQVGTKAKDLRGQSRAPSTSPTPAFCRRRPDCQEQGVLLRQLRGRDADPSASPRSAPTTGGEDRSAAGDPRARVGPAARQLACSSGLTTRPGPGRTTTSPRPPSDTWSRATTT